MSVTWGVQTLGAQPLNRQLLWRHVGALLLSRTGAGEFWGKYLCAQGDHRGAQDDPAAPRAPWRLEKCW